MDALIRLLLRFIIVPLGYVAAAIAGAAIILFASLPHAAARTADSIEQIFFYGFGFIVAAPVILAMIVGTMWLPATAGVLIAEALAIRTWIYHALNGAVTAWIGWQMLPTPEGKVPLHDIKFVIAAGIAGGFAYWAVAGWSAGFYKPVFAQAAPAALPPAATPPSGSPFNPPTQP